MPITARGRPSCRVYRYFWRRGRVCIHAHGRTRVYVCGMCIWLNPLGLEGRAVRVAWLVHGTEGDRYELQPLVRALAAPAHISALLPSSRFFLSSFFYLFALTAISPSAFVGLAFLTISVTISPRAGSSIDRRYCLRAHLRASRAFRLFACATKIILEYMAK